MKNRIQENSVEEGILLCIIVVIAQILGIFLEKRAEIHRKIKFLSHTPIKPCSSPPLYGTYLDRVTYRDSNDAITKTNEYCGTHVGNAVLDRYTKVQTLYFARLFFKDEAIVYAEITPERNLLTEFNNFYIQAWTL